MELREAKKLLRQLLPPARVEWVWLEQALGRILAADQFADRDIPALTHSLLDGFAIISSDTHGATTEKPCPLNLHKEFLAAGDRQEFAIQSGQCLRVLTGAPLPANADAVVAQENTSQENDFVKVTRSSMLGEGIALAGSDIQQGHLVLKKGSVLTPTRLALLAALGCAIIPAFIRPRVAFLATGSELKEIGQSREVTNVFCNNRHLLAWSAALQGALPIHLGIAGDDPEEITKSLKDVDADLIISTGGVGHGDRDYILQVWKNLGVEILFEEINISPGRRTALGKLDRRLFMGLPGGPWGAQVAFEQLLAPALRIYQGFMRSDTPSIPATLESSIRKRKGLHKVVRGTLHRESSKFIFQPAEKKSYSLFESISKSLCYVVIEPHISECTAGSPIEAHLYDLPLSAFPMFVMESGVEVSGNA